MPPPCPRTGWYRRAAAGVVAFVVLAAAVSEAVRDEEASTRRPPADIMMMAEGARRPPADIMMMAEGDMAEAEMAYAAADVDGGPPAPRAARMKSAPRSHAMPPPAPPEAFAARANSLGASVLEAVETEPFDAAGAATMLVRTGDVTIETADVDAVADAAAALAERRGGHVERRQDDFGWKEADGRARGRSATLKLRVPVAAYGDVMQAFKTGVGGSAPGDVRQFVDAARDVTADYVDAASRAAALEAARDRLLALMRRADDVKAVLSVQRELAAVTQQLEAKQAVATRLATAAALSTIGLRVQQRDDWAPPPDKPRKPFLVRTYARAFAWLGRWLAAGATVLVFLSVAAIPAAAVAAVAWAARRVRAAPGADAAAFAAPPHKS